MEYIHQLPNWPDLYWNDKKLLTPLASVRNQQGYLLGRMSELDIKTKNQATLEALTTEIIKSSQIEGELLDPTQVRASFAHRLGIDIKSQTPNNQYIEGIAEMTLDATQHFEAPLTKDRLFGWHTALFPTGRSMLRTISVGHWRTPNADPMQVVSGPIGREQLHFEAPSADRLDHEMEVFLDWFNYANTIDPILKAGIAHFWFLTIHPFEDGNGRIARAIANLCFARADGIPERFYSMSAQIEKERQNYRAILEACQRGGLDITQWLKWFFACLGCAIENTDFILRGVLYKTKLWQTLSQHPLNERQNRVLKQLLDDFEGKLTTTKYAKIADCSQDTALRDIQALIEYGAMRKSTSSGRSTSYVLRVRS